jgi:hypothetical protein
MLLQAIHLQTERVTNLREANFAKAPKAQDWQ